MFTRVTVLLLLVAVVAAAPEGDIAASAPDPGAPVVTTVTDEPRRVTASVEQEPVDEGDYDSSAPALGPAPNPPRNCSTIEGITGNMPGVDLFYERTCDRSTLPRHTSRSVTYRTSLDALPSHKVQETKNTDTQFILFLNYQ